MRYLVLGVLAGAIISLAFIAGYRQASNDDCCKPGQPKSILVKSGDGKRSLSIWSSDSGVGLSVGPIGGPYTQMISELGTSYVGVMSKDGVPPDVCLCISDRGERYVQLGGDCTVSVEELVKILKTLRASPRKRPDGRIGDGNPALPPS